jgi:hypothetical protein
MTDPVASLYCPTAHMKQLEAPLMELYWPAAHAVQA